MITRKMLLLLLFCCHSWSSFAQNLPNENLILYFNFDNNQLQEESSKGHGFINHNLSFGEGVNDTGLQLNGTDSFLEVRYSKELEVNNTLTTSIWYKHEDQATSTFYSLVEQSADELGGHSRYGTWIFDKRKVLVCVEPDVCSNGSPVCQRCVSGSDLLEEGKWYHIAATYSGDTLRVFVNGQISGQRIFTSSTGISTRPFPLTIGTDMYDPAPVYLKGTIDELKIYDIDFSIEQIETLFQEFDRTTTSIATVDALAFSFFPNPTTGFIHLQSKHSNGYYSIFNTMGMRIQEGNIRKEQIIDVQSLTDGLYFLQFGDRQQMSTKNFLVKRY